MLAFELNDNYGLYLHVKAAIDSAAEAARELGEVIATNVIARPSEGVRKLLTALG